MFQVFGDGEHTYVSLKHRYACSTEENTEAFASVFLKQKMVIRYR